MIKVVKVTIDKIDRRINLTVSKYLDLSNYYTKGEIDALISESINLHEQIDFADATGILTITFDDERRANFPRPKTQAFSVVVIDEETGETEDVEILGYLPTITKENDIIQSIKLDGIFGTGYILLTN